MLIYWIYLIAAIGFGVSGTMALTYASKNQTPKLMIITAFNYTISFIFLYYAIKKIEVGIAYAIWAGAGTAIMAISGVIIFKEQINFIKALFLMFIIVGSVGLKYFSQY